MSRFIVMLAVILTGIVPPVDAALLVGSTAAVEDPRSDSLHTSTGRHPARDLYRGTTTALSDAIHIYTSPLRIDRTTALWLGGIVAAGGILYAYDEKIFEWMNRHENEEPIATLSDIGEALEEISYGGWRSNRYFLGTLALGYITGLDPVTTASAQILESYIIAAGAKNLAEMLVGRRRPNRGLGAYSFEFNEGESFPSGHTSTIFQIATITSHHVNYLPFTIAAYTAATSVACQRLSADKHWPSDILLGAVYGTAVAKTVLRLHRDRSMTLRPAISGSTVGLLINYTF